MRHSIPSACSPSDRPERQVSAADEATLGSQRMRTGHKTGPSAFTAGVGRIVSAAAIVACAAATLAEVDAAGTITGKVYDLKTAGSIGSARVRVDDTNISAVTNTDGTYRLTGVPAGDVRLVVEYGGSTREMVNVAVTDGVEVRQNVGLKVRGADLEDDDVFTLAAFEVSGQSEFDARVMANSEERYSTLQKDVVAADQFGDNTDGNLGEFIKFLPGIDVEYGGEYSSGADATAVSIRGFGSDQTAIMVDGVEISGSNPGSLTRTVQLDMISVNNASRIEVSKLATADMPDGASGGVINLITRTAFEYPKPQFSWRAYFTANSQNLGDMFQKTPGPTNEETYKIQPSFDFSYVMPVNDKFGISFNGQYSQQFNENHTLKTQYKANRSYRDADGHYDHAGNPYVDRVSITDAPRLATRMGGSLKFDYRPTENQSLSFRVDHSEFTGTDSNRRLQISPDRPLDWGENEDGSGYVISQTNRGKTDMNVDFLDREGHTNNYYLNYKLDSGPWRVEATASTSRSKSSLESTKNGHFSTIELSSAGVGQMNLDQITDGLPDIVEITNRQGGEYLLNDLNNYRVNNLEEADDGGSRLTVNSGQTGSESIKDIYKIDVSRDLDFIPGDWLRLKAKTGFYRQEQTEKKSGRGTNYRYRYVGPVDEFDPTVYVDDVYVDQDPGFGFPVMTWVDPYKMYDFYQDNPTYFDDKSDVVYNNQESMASVNYNESVQSSKKLTETKDQWYVKFEGSMLNNRLTFDTGMRWSQSKREGYGPYQNKDWKFAQYPNGTVFYFSDGKPAEVDKDWQATYSDEKIQELVDAGFLSSPDANNVIIRDKTLAKKMREYIKDYPIDESARAKPLFNMQVAYELTSRLTARVGYSQKNGTPEYEGGYGILQRVTFDYPNSEFNSEGDDQYGTITIGNPALKPERTKDFDYQIAYYNNLGGKIKVNYFVSETQDYVITEPYEATLETLAAFDLPVDEEYVGWTINTVRNGEGTSRTTGWEFSVDQDLGFIGDWGRNVSFWGSYSTKSTEKDEDVSLADSAKDGIGGGISFKAGRLSGRVSAKYTSDLIKKSDMKWSFLTDPTDRNSRREYPEGHEDAGDEWKVQVYYREPANTKVDVNLNYQLSDRYSIFYSARNVTNSQSRLEIFDEEGILPDYVNVEQVKDFGVNMQLGVRGSF